jgi:hypothetical protein
MRRNPSVRGPDFQLAFEDGILPAHARLSYSLQPIANQAAELSWICKMPIGAEQLVGAGTSPDPLNQVRRFTVHEKGSVLCGPKHAAGLLCLSRQGQRKIAQRLQLAACSLQRWVPMVKVEPDADPGKRHSWMSGPWK